MDLFKYENVIKIYEKYVEKLKFYLFFIINYFTYDGLGFEVSLDY